MAGKQSDHVPALLNQDLVYFVGQDDLCFRYGVGHCFPQIGDDDFIRNVTTITKTTIALSMRMAVPPISPVAKQGQTHN